MRHTLLVIDDNKSVRESLRFLLLRRGYEVHVAEGGFEALAIAAQHVIHGALVDVNMPGMNGIEVCKELRALAAQNAHMTKVWMMTGARTPQTIKTAEEAGALVVLQKPFDFGDLFRRLDEALGGPPDQPRPLRDVLDDL